MWRESFAESQAIRRLLAFYAFSGLGVDYAVSRESTLVPRWRVKVSVVYETEEACTPRTRSHMHAPDTVAARANSRLRRKIGRYGEERS